MRSSRQATVSKRFQKTLAGLGIIVALGTATSCDGKDAVDAETGDFEQVSVIHPVDEGTPQQLVSFCLAKDGRVISLVQMQGGSDRHGNRLATAESAPAESASNTEPAEVRILDADGKELSRWPVDFLAQAVNVGPDGSILLGGDGSVARYTEEGKQLAKADAPNLAAISQDPEALEREARELVEQQNNSSAAVLEMLEKQKKDLEGKSDSELSEDERALKGQIDQIIDQYREQVKQEEKKSDDQVEEQQKKQIEQMKQMLIARNRKISAIAGGGEHVFITCAASKGFGYAVWRTDQNLQDPVQTVDGLSGCCGQMDVQCCNDELIVAENARHRVVRYDSSGKQLASFGKRNRDGDGENFGGCCNPMNTRLVGDQLYVAESDGRVKLFTVDGEFQKLLGKANVSAGCKSSIVDVSPDGSRIYYFDVEKSSICVLQRGARSTADARN